MEGRGIGVHVTDYTLAHLAYSGVKSPSLHLPQPHQTMPRSP